MPSEDGAFRIRRLDTIRFLAALWVALSHGAIPWQSLSDERYSALALKALGASFSGVCAVMVFFIVSGLCIHLPQVGGRKSRFDVASAMHVAPRSGGDK